MDDTPGLRTKIDNLIEGNNVPKLFTEDDEPRDLSVIISELKTYSHSEISCGEWLETSEIYEAVREYKPHPAERKVVDKRGSPKAISTVLLQYEDHRDVEFQRRSKGKANRYRIRDFSGGFKDIDIEKPTDIPELSCMQNIDDYLHEQKPTRWILYQVARILMSLEPDFTLEEIAEDFFSRYPWYDRETTMYQLRYEQNRTINGEVPKPIGCKNDNKNFDTFCIGMENCSYSIYSSLPMKDSVRPTGES